jgi:hypothetical protein
MARMAACGATLAVLLQGCAQPPAPPPPPPPPPLPHHAGPPPAKTCTVAPFSVKDGGTADVQMTVSNEGGYCAATLTAASGQPFDAPLVPVPPLHGVPRVVKYNGKTSVEAWRERRLSKGAVPADASAAMPERGCRTGPYFRPSE